MAVLQQEQQSADALRERVRAIWTAGDFGRIAVSYEASLI
jgi:hypothetical protein